MSQPILVVDDDSRVRGLIQLILTLEGFQTMPAADGISAFASIEAANGEIGLLVTDFEMPGCNGAVLAAWVKEQYPAIPILLVSGCMEAVACSSPGACIHADGLLRKPFSGSDLIRAARALYQDND